MIPESLQILAVVLAIVALISIAAALMLWRRTRPATRGFAALAESLDRRAEQLPIMIGTARAALAERAATIEHAQWLITRSDSRVEAAKVALRQRTAALDELREKMERNRARAETLKSTARLIMKALELRRTFL